MNQYNRGGLVNRNIGISVKSHGLFWYELTNLTLAGGNSAYPIASETVLYDLRVTHRLHDGSYRDITLFDSDGVRQVDIDCATVFLRSDPMEHRVWIDVASVKVTGRIRPTTIAIRESDWHPEVTVRVHPEFALDMSESPLNLYEALYVTDNFGRRYNIGTIGISSVDVSGLPNRIGRSTCRVSPRRVGMRRSSGHRTSR